MARIRSVHPGLFTDEHFMEVSPLARLFHIGIWTECDDQGIFAWKPRTLKVRILPADGADGEQLLNELLGVNMIMKFEVDGNIYGAVRNFRRAQRPEKPNSIHPITPEVAEYVGLGSTTHTGSEKKPPPYGGDDGGAVAAAAPKRPRGSPDQSANAARQVGDDSGSAPQKLGQMEDGIGEGEGKEGSKSSGLRPGDGLPPTAGELGVPDARDRLWREGVPALRSLIGKPEGATRSFLGKLLKTANDDCAGLLAAIAEARDRRVLDPVSHLTAAAARLATPPPNSFAARKAKSDAFMREFLAGDTPADPDPSLPLLEHAK